MIVATNEQAARPFSLCLQLGLIEQPERQRWALRATLDEAV